MKRPITMISQLHPDVPCRTCDHLLVCQFVQEKNEHGMSTCLGCNNYKIAPPEELERRAKLEKSELEVIP